MKLSKYFGPSTLVAAAFIGPGTVTTCTLAGVKSGYSLIWALIFSTIATIILQEMSARLGFISKSGLGEALRNQFQSGVPKYFVYFLVIGAILVGNAAYEAGNLTGGALGLSLLTGSEVNFVPILFGITLILLSVGAYPILEKCLIALVILMSLCFIVTAIWIQADIIAILKGMLPFGFQEFDFLLIMGLIGTTVVPYNLFLHASTISKKYKEGAKLKDIRLENRVSIMLGGLVSILIIITSAASSQGVQEVESAQDLAHQLEPVFGGFAQILMGIGLLAAGLSSAITAPLATAYASQGLFPSLIKEGSVRYKLVAILILCIGTFVSLMGYKPILVIQFAQITNAILLPLIAGYLLWVCNKKSIMGLHVNTKVQNILGWTVILTCFLISIKTVVKLIG